jgi:hypothetical protein
MFMDLQWWRDEQEKGIARSRQRIEFDQWQWCSSVLTMSIKCPDEFWFCECFYRWFPSSKSQDVYKRSIQFRGFHKKFIKSSLGSGRHLNISVEIQTNSHILSLYYNTHCSYANPRYCWKVLDNSVQSWRHISPAKDSLTRYGLHIFG